MRKIGAVFVGAIALVGCGGAKPAPKEESAVQTQAANAEEPVARPCTGSDLDLMAVLIQSACEVKDSDGKPFNGKNLEIKLTASAEKIEPGKAVDLLLTYTNKGKGPLPLEFKLDPEPRFSVEAYDEKELKRVDLPKGSPPKGGGDEATSTTPGVARATLDAGGTARVRLTWQASKMRWAPEKLKGSVPGQGFPKAPGGPLSKGKYVIHMVTPLSNAPHEGDREFVSPKVVVEVGKL